MSLLPMPRRGDVAFTGTLRLPGKFGDGTGGLRDMKEVAKVHWEMRVRSTGWIPKDEFGIPRFCPNKKIILASFPGGGWGCNPGLWKLKDGGKPLGDGWRESWMEIKSQEAFLEESGAATWVENLGGVSDGFQNFLQEKKTISGSFPWKGDSTEDNSCSPKFETTFIFPCTKPSFWERGM